MEHESGVFETVGVPKALGITHESTDAGTVADLQLGGTLPVTRVDLTTSTPVAPGETPGV